jgi:hypothetical protein
MENKREESELYNLLMEALQFELENLFIESLDNPSHDDVCWVCNKYDCMCNEPEEDCKLDFEVI